MNNPFAQLNNLYNKPLMLPGEVSQVDHLSPEDKTLLRRIGLTSTQVQHDLLADAQIFYDRYNIYHQVEKALEHPIVGAATELYANYCCLTGDTRIPLLDGRTLTIREILEEHKVGKENWVYSCDTNGKPQPAKIVNAVKQKHTPKTYRVWLDNGKFVDASDNHKFIKRDGSLCRTDELVVGDSLMPFARCLTDNRFELVWDVAGGMYVPTLDAHGNWVRYTDVSFFLQNAYFLTTSPCNYKITKIECIGEQVVYDIEVTGSHLFGLDVGIYISNTVFSPMHNATIWVTSESPTYQKELTKLMDRIGIEEKIFDWAFTAGSYGDMFVKVNGIPGQGVISIDDSDHPINISRVDHEGVLIGYYKTPVGQAGDQQRLMAPWEYVHFRLLGGKKQRPQFGDQSYAEYRTVHLLTGLRSKQVTTRYGTSVIMNALAIYRRLRLAEDSLLIARLSRGLIRYVWKLKVDSANMEAVGELIDQYSRVLREARSMDTSAGSPNLESKENPMSSIEDIFIPVWDNVGDLTFDKIGGETDIRWIKDIEDLRQQLASALRTPLPLLGAWLKEATGALGSQAIEKVDINFARMARKLQRTVRTGIKRICQIHLAYMNMDPDPNLFDVQMPEMSTAEEESLKASLKDGMEVVSSMMEVISDIVDGTDKQLDKIEIFNYLNEKILKLEDFDLKEYLVAEEVAPIEEAPIEELPEEEQPFERKRQALRDKTLRELRENKFLCEKRKGRMAHEIKVKELLDKSMSKEDKDRVFNKPCLFDTDLQSFVPTQTQHADGRVNEVALKKLERSGGWLGIERCMEKWNALYGNAMILDKEVDDSHRVDSVVVADTPGQLTLPFDKES